MDTLVAKVNYQNHLCFSRRNLNYVQLKIICSLLVCPSRVTDARRKFSIHERRGV